MARQLGVSSAVGDAGWRFPGSPRQGLAGAALDEPHRVPAPGQENVLSNRSASETSPVHNSRLTTGAYRMLSSKNAVPFSPKPSASLRSCSVMASTQNFIVSD